MNNLESSIHNQSSLHIKQRKELLELLGIETRNKYEIFDSERRMIGFIAEQTSGFLGFILQQLLGHWRKFELAFFDTDKNLCFRAVHPFRFYFHRLNVFDSQSRPLGSLERRFSILNRRFLICGPQDEPLFEVVSPLFRIWTFNVLAGGQEVAVIRKKWSGLFQEVFLDSDAFHIQFNSALIPNNKTLLLAAGMFIDLTYFEKRAD